MSSCIELTIGARESPLSKAQVKEVHQELTQFYPHIAFRSLFVKTMGDVDKKTSLRELGQTDFFTKEIDQMQLKELFRISIHSAKDLANPIAQGLKIVALTKGVDSSDVLVLREGETLEALPKHALIATSSKRREENVAALKSGLCYVDIRGYIGERLEQLYCGKVDGVVIAEAALIRLGLTHLNRAKLPGETTPLQGRLAIIAREKDQEMKDLFQCLDY